jgi:hypothetical protein
MRAFEATEMHKTRKLSTAQAALGELDTEALIELLSDHLPTRLGRAKLLHVLRCSLSNVEKLKW